MTSTKKETSLNKQCALLQPFGDNSNGKPLLLRDIESFQQEEIKLLNGIRKIISKSVTTPAEKIRLKEMELQLKPVQNSRLKLLQQLTYVSSSSQCSLSGDRRALQDQLAMLMVSEDQLKMMEKQMQQLINSKNNQHRMVQITNYENNRFASHASIFKTIAFCSLFILGGIYIKGKGWDTIGTTMIVLAIAIAIFLTVKKIWWNYWRSSMNWNQFEWDPNTHANNKNPSVWEVDKKFFDKGYDAAKAEVGNVESQTENEYDKIKKKASKAYGDFENNVVKDYNKSTNTVGKSKGHKSGFASFN